MTLVERFVEIGHWPTSRKVLLWSGVLLFIHALAWAGVWLNEFAFSGLAADAGLVNFIFGSWAALLTLSVLLALAPALRGADARWTGYAFILLYATPVLPVLGYTNNGTVLMYLPMIALFGTVFFEERVGGIALLYLVAMFVVMINFDLDGALPHFPAAAAAAVPRAMEVLLALTFILIVLLCVLMASARRVQERRLAETRDAIRRFVPAQVADAILSGRHAETGRHERRKLTIFFSDIVGFTDISEELEPEDLSRVLNEYFAEMMQIAHKHGGTVDELSGDAILVFFGAPHATDDKDHALRAVRMALEMQGAMAGLNAKWASAGITESLRVRMGINTGVVTIGNFGSPERMKYAALGKHVNVAARLQSGGEAGKVVISHATWLLVNDQVRCTPLGERQLKGIQKPVMTYVAEVASA